MQRNEASTKQTGDMKMEHHGAIGTDGTGSPSSHLIDGAPPSNVSVSGKVSSEAILNLIRQWTVEHNLSMPTDPGRTFVEAGFDSLASIELAFFLEERLGVAIDDTVLYDHPTFAALSRYVEGLFPSHAG
jgi:acyl carrier protein